MPSCAITKSGRFDEYGRPLTVGATYTGTLDQCRSLVQSGFATMSAADLDDGSTGGLAQPSLVAPQLTVTQALQTPVSVEAMAFSQFPAAADSACRIIRCSDFQSSPSFISDGVRWRPLNGVALLRILGATWVGAAATGIQIVDSFQLPAALLHQSDGIRVSFCGERLAGTSDTVFFRVKFAGQTVLAPALGTTTISGDSTWLIKRESSVSVRKANAGGNNVWGDGAQTAARAAAVTVPDMDTNPTTIELSATLVSGVTEYPVVSHYSVELVG